jgi:hypothetical protein
MGKESRTRRDTPSLHRPAWECVCENSAVTPGTSPMRRSFGVRQLAAAFFRELARARLGGTVRCTAGKPAEQERQQAAAPQSACGAARLAGFSHRLLGGAWSLYTCAPIFVLVHIAALSPLRERDGAFLNN